MDALPLVDTLFKEYILFRGFTTTLQTFSRELAVDKGCGYQPDRITDLIFKKIIPELRCQELVEFLDFLNDRLYSRLDASFNPTIQKLEASVQRLLLVRAVKAGRLDKVQEFFKLYGQVLLEGPDAATWRPWCALGYLKQPHKDPTFQGYFSQDWADLLQLSFRNFMTEVLRNIPLPAVLRFNTDRLQRLKLQQQVDALQAELDRLRRQLAEQQTAAAEAAGGAVAMSAEASSSAGAPTRWQPHAARAVAAAPLGAEGPTTAAAAWAPATASRQAPTVMDSVAADHVSTAAAVDIPLRRLSAAGEGSLAVSVSPEHKGAYFMLQQQQQQQQQRSAAASPELSSTPAGTPDGARVVQSSPATAAIASSHTANGDLEPATAQGAGSPPPSPGVTATAAPPLSALAPFSRQQKHKREASLIEWHALEDAEDVTSGEDLAQTATTAGQHATAGGQPAGPVAVAGQAAHRDRSPSQRASPGKRPATAVRPRGVPEPDNGPALLPRRNSYPSLTVSTSRPQTPPSPVPARNNDPTAAANTDSATATSTPTPLYSPATVPGGGAGASISSFPLPPGAVDYSSGSPRRFHGWPYTVAHLESRAAHGGAVTAAQFSPGGRNVASASLDGTVSIWAPATDGNTSRQATLQIGAPVPCLTWDTRADKVMLMGTADKGIRVWHLDTRRMMAETAADPLHPHVTAICCCPTEPVFACATADEQPRTAAAASPFTPSRPAGGQSPASASKSSLAAAVATTAAATSTRGKLSVWNMRSFKRQHTFTIPGDPPMLQLCYSVNGQWLAAAGANGRLYLIDANRGQLLRTWAVAQPGTVLSLAFREAGSSAAKTATATTLVTCAQQVLQEWSVLQPRGTPIQTVKLLQPQPGTPSSPSPDGGGRNAAGQIGNGNNGIGRPVVSSMCLSPDGALAAVAVTDGWLHLVDLDTGRQQQLLQAEALEGGVTLDWHPAKPLLICGTASGAVECLELYSRDDGSST